MASSRPASPMAEDRPSTPTQLTPRSKVKAMLAAMEVDSDGENQKISALDILQTPSKNRASVDASEDDDEEIIRPRGRLAARMQADTAQQSDSDRQSPAADARERVRRLLAANEGTTSADEDIPAVRRQPKKGTSPVVSLRSSPQSGGLFVSPESTRSRSIGADSNSDSDELPINPVRNERFMALVQKKREERLAKEAELKRQKAEREAERAKQKQASAPPSDNDLFISDEEGEQRLTQQSRPTRKASKKALEEMERETQRMSRNMQLAHEARTKKKITKASLFAKFNYKPAGVPVEVETEPTSSSPRQSDRDTPPSSPPAAAESTEKVATETAPDVQPMLENALREPSPPVQPVLDKGKGKAIEVASPKKKWGNIKVHFTNPDLSDSDSDLEVVTKTPIREKIDKIFDNIPIKQQKEPHSLQALRVLAHIGSPDRTRRRKNLKPSMNNSELQLSLQKRAREQAMRERDERVQALRARGIIVLTAEEREKEMAEVENLLQRARQEGEEIMRREKEAAKKERKEKGEADSEDDDEEWTRSDIELSGSEDGDDEEEVDVVGQTGMFDDEASEDEDEEEELEAAGEMSLDEDEDETVAPQLRRRQKTKTAISDDEDDAMDVVPQSPIVRQRQSPVGSSTDSPQAPMSVLRSATKTFIPGLTVKGPVGLGLTQIFAGTMDDSQDQSQSEDIAPTPTLPEAPETGNNTMAFLRRGHAPSLPPFEPTAFDSQSQDVVEDSQTPVRIPQSQAMNDDSQGIVLNFSQSQVHEFDSLLRDPSTQMSEYPEATQDGGFQYNSPVGRFQDVPSTVDTVLLPGSPTPDMDSPIVKRKGRLRQRAQVMAFSDDEETPGPAVDEDEFEITADVFNVMRKAAKKQKTVEEFNKKKSEAKAMFEEQAEESEDEYAGLGGASDDESDAEADEYTKQIIDDDGGEEVDESKLAAFFADKERANDEKQVEKLFNDITNGMLRRRRGGDYDLSDSDDGEEARRRRKRREFAKMRKALLADERLEKIAENPKKAAFMRAVEDLGEESSIDFLDGTMDLEELHSQSQSQSQTEGGEPIVPDSQSEGNTGEKRKHDSEGEPAMRLPPNLRRTKGAKRPSNISEIRKSVSSLIEDQNSFQETVHDSESEEEEQDETQESATTDKENYDPFARRHSNVNVVDRISQKRNATSHTVSNSTRLAFGVGVNGPNGAFKVPALLRRATTNSSVASSSSTISTSTTSTFSAASRGGASAMGMGGESGVRRAVGKNSGVNFFARENERRAKLAEMERKRNEKRWSGARERRKAVGGLFGKGKFE